MIVKGRSGLWMVLGGLVAWIAMKKLAAYLGLLKFFWPVFSILVFLVVVAFFWRPSLRQEPDPGDEEKLAA